jgi:cytochrome c-type biogenesis protein CcmH/NrfG
VRRLLAGKLAALGRWDELVALLRERVRLRPLDADAHMRLGAALLYAANAPEEASQALRESIRLEPGNARAYGALGSALNALGEHPEAVAAFDEALRLEPDFFDGRPASRLVFEASQRGEAWPLAAPLQ